MDVRLFCDVMFWLCIVSIGGCIVVGLISLFKGARP